ncbi:MAG: GIY-YIG nuclease family protein [Patescibacteria group bacterium]
MHYVYLLRSNKTSEFYIGSTADLVKRFYQHNDSQNTSTKYGVPWTLVYYEAFPTKATALERERKLKRYGKGLVELKKRLGFRK